MKKVLLTAALGCTLLAPAFAGGNTTASHNGSLQCVVNDYITLDPSTPFAAGPVVFNTPQQMVDGVTYPANQMTVTASRAWKFEYSSTDFVRDNSGDPAGPGVALTVPTGNIWYVATGNGSTGVNTFNGTFISSNNAAQNMANQATGTLSSTFDLSAKLVPGLTNQMSGTYNTTITQIASLD